MLLTWSEEVAAGLIEKLNIGAIHKVLKAPSLIRPPPCCNLITCKQLLCYASASECMPHVE